jgi:hypothetical protein
MGSIAKLKVAPPPPSDPLSPARQELAAEIQRERVLRQRREALTIAHSKAMNGVYDARDAVEKAEAAVEQAKVAVADWMVAQATGNAGDPPVTVRAARQMLQDSEDELTARVAARDELARQLTEADQFPHLARDRLRTAALNVIRAEAGNTAARVLEMVEHLQRELTRVGFALTWLHHARVYEMHDRPGMMNQATDPRIETALARLRSPPETWNELHRIDELRGDVQWAVTLDRLMEDPTATLPT